MKLERVQILRFVAAAAVLAFHSDETLARHVPDPGRIWPLRHGDFGVDLFFVISGFIIHLTVRARERDWRLFIERRLLRVVPLYWICTLAMFALFHVTPGVAPPSASDLARSLLFSAWTGGPLAMPIVYLGWSLEYEIFFYALTAVAMMLHPKPWRLLCPLLALLVAGGVVAGITGPTRAWHALLNPMLLEFVFGVLVGELLYHRRLPWLSVLAVAAALVLIFSTGWGQRV